MSLQDLRDSVIADGVVDADEVATLRTELYADGVIDQDEAVTLFEINNAVSGNANDPAWDDLFVQAITDFVLQDDETPGVVDDGEARFLNEQIASDGQVDDLERRLLDNIRANATSVSPLLINP